MHVLHTVFKMAAPTDDQKIHSKLRFIYQKCHRNGVCLLVGVGSRTRNGYPRYHLRYPGYREVNTTLPRAVYILEHRRPELIRNVDAGEVSHRCGEKACVEVQHLLLESPSDNKKRIICHSHKRCGGCSPPCIIR